MKRIAYAFSASALFLFVTPAISATTVIGKGQTVDCFEAAQKAALNSLPVVLQGDALAACSSALQDKISVQDRTATLINRGLVEIAANRTGEAIADLETALARDPSSADAYTGHGLALLRSGRYEAARADFDRALSLNPEHAYLVYYDKAAAEEKSGQFTAAYHDYRHALALAPDFTQARIELSRYQVVEKRVVDNR